MFMFIRDGQGGVSSSGGMSAAPERTPKQVCGHVYGWKPTKMHTYVFLLLSKESSDKSFYYNVQIFGDLSIYVSVAWHGYVN